MEFSRGKRKLVLALEKKATKSWGRYKSDEENVDGEQQQEDKGA